MRVNRLRAYPQGARLLQRLVYVIIFAVLVIFIVNYSPQNAGWRYYGCVVALAALLALNFLWSNPDPETAPRFKDAQEWAFLVLSTGLVLAIAWMSAVPSLVYLVDITIVQTCFKKGVWPTGLIFGSATLAVVLILLITGGTPFWGVVSFLFPVAVGIIFVLAVMTMLERYAVQIQRTEALLKELQAANTALEAARQKEKDLAVAEERVRLARDIHDGLGHHLTVLSIQLQAAGKLVGRDPQAAAEAIQACRTEAQSALEEVRRSVGMLRQPPSGIQPLSELLGSLVGGFEARAGYRASLEIHGTPVELSPQASETIYRAAQEGLTNVQKHAYGVRRIRVTLAYEAQAVRLCLEDDGLPVDESVAVTPGYGLAGLRERADQLGGTFKSGPVPAGGFAIELVIPAGGKAP